MRIVLIGAYGYTAKIIGEKLKEVNLPFVAAGRDLSQLNSLATENTAIQNVLKVDLMHQGEVNDLIQAFDLFINCAGPFTEESDIFLKAIARAANKIYIDITGELGFVKRSFEEFNAPAKINQTLILHACAFESLIAGLGAQILCDLHENIETIATYYSFEKSRPSPGTKITMKLANLRTFSFLQDGNWKSIQTGYFNHNFELNKDTLKVAVAYPLPEVAFFNADFNAKNVGTYLLLDKEEALFAGNSDPAEEKIPELLRVLKSRKSEGPSSLERGFQQSLVVVEATDNYGKKSRIDLFCTDMYRITALSVVLIVELLMKERRNKTGVINPSNLFERSEKETLNKLGITFSLKT